MNNIIFGIDLGTTNSALAIYMGNKAEIVPIENRATFPSVVEYKSNGEVLTGVKAYRHKGKPNVVYSAKRDMGTDTVYTLTLPDGSTKKVTPVDVASEVLKGIKNKASKAYGEIENVVITVPAYFNHKQRNATLEAAKLAGLNCLKIINEPTAASLAYGLDINQSEEIIVIDVGGGTTDITAVTITNIDKVHPILKDVLEEGISFDITNTGGNNRLGGDDYNRMIYDLAVEDAGHFYHVNIEDIMKNITPEHLIPKIENWKLNKDSSIVQETCTIDNKEVVVTLIPEYKELAMKTFWQKIFECINECLTIKDINDNGEIVEINKKRLPQHCLLVGGSTKNKYLVDCLKEYYSKNYKKSNIIIPNNTFADYAVALGAAVQGALIGGTADKVNIKELNPLPVGVEHAITINDKPVEGYFYTMIPKDAPIPVSHTETYYTTYDNQEELVINVYQGTSNLCKYNLKLGEVHVTGLERKPAGEVKILLTFSININGILTVETTYNGKTSEATIESVLNKKNTIDLTAKDKAIIRKIESGKTFILRSNKYTEMLEVLNSWTVGTQPSKEIIQFFKEHQEEINEFNSNGLTHLFDNRITNYDDDDEVSDNG